MKWMILIAFLFHSSHQTIDQKKLKALLMSALDTYIPEPPRYKKAENNTREKRQVQSADPGAIMYLPIGGSGNVR